MKTKFEVVEDVPQWAVCGFLYDDWSGCNDEDIKQAKAFEDSLAKMGLKLCGIVDGSENDFCPHPAFGLACATTSFSAMKASN